MYNQQQTKELQQLTKEWLTSKKENTKEKAPDKTEKLDRSFGFTNTVIMFKTTHS